MNEAKASEIRTPGGMLHGILAQMPVGIVVSSAEGPIWMNRAAADLAGYQDPAEVAGLGLKDLVHPDDLAEAAERARIMLETGETQGPAVFRIRHRSGGWARLEVVPLQVVELEGRRANLLLIRGFSDHKEVEEALRVTESRYRAIFDFAGVGILLVDGDDRVVAANPAVRGLLSWDDFQPGEVRIQELVHPDDMESLDEHSRELGEGSVQEFDHELRMGHSDGETVWVHLQCSCVRDEGGAPLYRVAIVEDISERKQLEEQLRLAQRLESIGRLAGGIAHDFNNIITVISGHTDLLIDSLTAEPSLLEDLREIRHAADRAASLTRQLLAFSRRQVLQPRVVSLNDVVSGMRRMLERIIGEDVTTSFELSPDLGLVRADPAQIEQVILNLVVNARDAMPTGGRLRITTGNEILDEAFVHGHPGSAAGPHVSIAIADTGHGMDQEVIARIFEPFFTTKDPGKGTGLGLSMSYGIVKQSDGYILVESVPWEGSTFTIYLPSVEEAEVSVGEPRAAPLETAGHETVLVVEDEAMVRELARRILNRFGYQVLVAEDARAALELVRRHEEPIDLLLTDVVMPGMWGPELADRVRELRPGIPVLFMSGYTDDAVGSQGVLEAGVPFLQKPFAPEGLAQKVRQALAEAQRPQGDP